MVIELRGVEFVNKGAELMLHSIIAKIREDIPDAKFVMENTTAAPRSKHLEYGLYTKTNFKKFKIKVETLFKLIPASLRFKYHFINDDEIDVVLDGSGFAFGDQWGAKKAGFRMANHIVLWKKQGKKVILLPQAFGPFSNNELKEKMVTIIKNADLICARDKVSYKYITELYEGATNIVLRPDFTNLMKGILPASFESMKGKIAIIPNSKMIETASKEGGIAYMSLLKRVIRLLKASGNEPFFLIHEGRKDIGIAKEINSDETVCIPVIQEDNPLYVKGMIGACSAVITSRFHGLVSCLSQSVPCISTGWSHKYEMLLDDYNYSEALVDVNCTEDLLSERIASLIDPVCRKEIIDNLNIRSIEQKRLSNEMWRDVITKIKS